VRSRHLSRGVSSSRSLGEFGRTAAPIQQCLRQHCWTVARARIEEQGSLPFRDLSVGALASAAPGLSCPGQGGTVRGYSARTWWLLLGDKFLSGERRGGARVHRGTVPDAWSMPGSADAGPRQGAPALVIAVVSTWWASVVAEAHHLAHVPTPRRGTGNVIHAHTVSPHADSDEGAGP